MNCIEQQSINLAQQWRNANTFVEKRTISVRFFYNTLHIVCIALKILYSSSIKTINGDIDGNGMKEIDENIRLHFKAKALVSPVDVDFIQLQDSGLNIDRHLLSRGKGGGAPAFVSRVSVGLLWFARLDALHANHPRQLLGGDDAT